MKGRVILVGGGPGDAGLLTLRGAEALQQADVVLFDRLISPEILSLIPERAVRIDAGKRPGHHPISQEEINRILVREACEGKNVVRLKSGDNYLFGRGGEEAQALREAGIDFEVAPGVTSALAVPACAGIPVTHRDFCSSVHIITAHARAGGVVDIDYGALLRLNGTMVFLMGVAAMEKVLQGLLDAGAASDLPAAIIENGARPDQRKIVATVSTLAERARAMNFHSPAVIIVGNVCVLADELDWFSARPLFGLRVAVTRPRSRSSRLTERLRGLGADVWECPCIETVENEDVEPLRRALKNSSDWAVFTSSAGVHAAVHGLLRLGRDLRALYKMKLAAIGPATAETLASYGLAADLIPQQYDGVHLAEELQRHLSPGDGVLLLRGEDGGAELPRRLLEAKATVSDVPLYRTVRGCKEEAVLQDRLRAGTLDCVAFTSPSTVEGFAESAGNAPTTGFIALCIGERTASTARRYGMKTKTARNATIEDMIDCLLEEMQNGANRSSAPAAAHGKSAPHGA